MARPNAATYDVVKASRGEDPWGTLHPTHGWLITEAPDGTTWEQYLTRPVAEVMRRTGNGFEHYSKKPEFPYFFYKGVFSSFYAMPFTAYMLDEPDLGKPVLPNRWQTREHWFQAHKPPPDDLRARWAIAETDDPAVAKALGGSRTAFTIRPDWDEGASYQAMLAGIIVQMGQYRQLREAVDETGERLIAEDSPRDSLWSIRDTGGGLSGHNLLGAAWMAARDHYRDRKVSLCVGCDRRVPITYEDEEGDVFCPICIHGSARLM